MTYLEFTDNFMLHLARSYRNNQIQFHALVDTDLWRKILPDTGNDATGFHWYNIKLNAFTLSDKENSLLIVYSMPVLNKPREVKFIGLRLDSKRSSLLFYTLRRPKYNDEAWDICQYDFDDNTSIFIDKIQGTDSLREFRNNIERIEFREKQPAYIRLRSKFMN